MFSFENIGALEKAAVPTSHSCKCGGNRELHLINTDVIIDSKFIEVVDCPVLICNKCGAQRLGDLMYQCLFDTYEDMVEQNYSKCRTVTRNTKKFSYCEADGYIYDNRDLNVPAVQYDMEHSKPGFFCPVYFDRKVLFNFFHDDDYTLNLFSETYGFIGKKGTSGYEWDWIIDFGINTNNKVVIWLGDLEDIDERAKFWFKSYNIESDHKVVESEFFMGQFMNNFSKPIVEKRILKLRDSFYKKMQAKYNVNLFHLEDEVEAKGEKLSKPIKYSEDEISRNIVSLDGLLNEGIDCDELRKIYEAVCGTPEKGYKDLKTRKLLERLIKTHNPKIDAQKVVAPLYYLNDLRVCFAHLISEAEVQKCHDRIVSAYSLRSFDDYKSLYEKLMMDIYYLYQYLNIEEI
ncbi:MAG: hypothetical protein RSC15_07960 [Lactococcus sp.]